MKHWAEVAFAKERGQKLISLRNDLAFPPSVVGGCAGGAKSVQAAHARFFVKSPRFHLLDLPSSFFSMLRRAIRSRPNELSDILLRQIFRRGRQRGYRESVINSGKQNRPFPFRVEAEDAQKIYCHVEFFAPNFSGEKILSMT